jgi:hypothetical protein
VVNSIVNIGFTILLIIKLYYGLIFALLYGRIWGGGGVYRVLVGKPEEMRPLGRPWRRWEDYIKMDLQDVECRVWTELS